MHLPYNCGECYTRVQSKLWKSQEVCDDQKSQGPCLYDCILGQEQGFYIKIVHRTACGISYYILP